MVVVVMVVGDERLIVRSVSERICMGIRVIGFYKSTARRRRHAGSTMHTLNVTLWASQTSMG